MTDQRQPENAGPNHWRHVLRRANEHMLFAEDVGPVGTKVNVEIVDSGVLAVKSRSGSESMPWIGFRGKKKKLGLNRTNCKVLETLCGTPDWVKWRGAVTLVVIRTRAPDRDSGQMIETDAIRVAPERPSGSPQRSERARGAADGAPDRDEQADIARRERQENA